MNVRQTLKTVGVVAALSLLLAACAHQPPASDDGPGFFLGVFHGFTVLPAFIFSFFFDVEIYAFPNDGWPYDAGFVLGILIALGGGAGAARRGY